MTRINTTLGPTDDDNLDTVVEKTKLSRNDAIRKALATEAFIQKLDPRAKLLVEGPDGTIRQIEFVS